MKIHEYQAKELLAAAGAAVPPGVVVSTPAEAQQAFDKLGGPVVLKAQVHAGGRGKGTFKGSGKDYGGVKFVKTRAEAGQIAEVMFKLPPRHQADRRGGAKGVEGAGRERRGQDRQGNLRRRRAGPLHRPAGGDGLRRGRRRDRGGRR